MVDTVVEFSQHLTTLFITDKNIYFTFVIMMILLIHFFLNHNGKHSSTAYVNCSHHKFAIVIKEKMNQQNHHDNKSEINVFVCDE
jgi:hypothetical protein